MSPRTKRWIKDLFVGFVYCVVAGFAYVGLVMQRPLLSTDAIVVVGIIGILLTLSLGFAGYFIRPVVARMTLVPAVLLRAASNAVAILVSVVGGAWMANVIILGFQPAQDQFGAIIRDPNVWNAVIFAAPLLILFTLLSGISQKLGPGVLANWLLGRYHQPRQENRIFMFLDLRGSTGLAEKLGDLRFSALIRDVFRDVTRPLLDNGAEISHFIGDEVVVAWPLARGVKDGQCIRCFFSVVDEFERRASRYRDLYGFVPSFKAGMHCGPVVTTEVGQIKSEIVFHGDVLNTTARLQSLCGEEVADLLISDDLAQAVPAPRGIVYERLGPRQLKGKEQLVEIVRVTRI